MSGVLHCQRILHDGFRIRDAERIPKWPLQPRQAAHIDLPASPYDAAVRLLAPRLVHPLPRSCLIGRKSSPPLLQHSPHRPNAPGTIFHGASVPSFAHTRIRATLRVLFWPRQANHVSQPAAFVSPEVHTAAGSTCHIRLTMIVNPAPYSDFDLLSDNIFEKVGGRSSGRTFSFGLW
jgi:hypothetical protein